MAAAFHPDAPQEPVQLVERGVAPDAQLHPVGRSLARTDRCAVFRAVRRRSLRRGSGEGLRPVRDSMQWSRRRRIRLPGIVWRQMQQVPGIAALTAFFLLGMIERWGESSQGAVQPQVGCPTGPALSAPGRAARGGKVRPAVGHRILSQ